MYFFPQYVVLNNQPTLLLHDIQYENENMKMVNTYSQKRGFYTESELEEKMIRTGCLPVATYQQWKKRGYHVKQGEKSIMTILIWKHKDKKLKNEDTDNEEIEPEKYIKVKAYFFNETQVIKDV